MDIIPCPCILFRSSDYLLRWQRQESTNVWVLSSSRTHIAVVISDQGHCVLFLFFFSSLPIIVELLLAAIYFVWLAAGPLFPRAARVSTKLELRLSHPSFVLNKGKSYVYRRCLDRLLDSQLSLRHALNPERGVTYRIILPSAGRGGQG